MVGRTTPFPFQDVPAIPLLNLTDKRDRRLLTQRENNKSEGICCSCNGQKEFSDRNFGTPLGARSFQRLKNQTRPLPFSPTVTSRGVLYSFNSKPSPRIDRGICTNLTVRTPALERCLSNASRCLFSHGQHLKASYITRL